MNTEAFIVKVQLSQVSSDDIKHILIYNENRDIYYQTAATPEFIKLMKGQPKQFFWAQVVNGQINIHQKADWQNW